MNKSIATKLSQLAARLDELNRLLSAESATRDLDAYRRLTREHSEIAPWWRSTMPISARSGTSWRPRKWFPTRR